MTVYDKEKIFDKNKVNKSLKSIEWGTPPEIFNPLNDEFNFTLDVCANENNSRVARFFTQHNNGLVQSWDNEVCWCNPPYGREVQKWCKKAYEQSKKGTTTVLLIPCKTNTKWWHKLVIPYAEVRFLSGRVKFVYPNGEQSTQALPWPLAFVIYKPIKDFANVILS